MRLRLSIAVALASALFAACSGSVTGPTVPHVTPQPNPTPPAIPTVPSFNAQTVSSVTAGGTIALPSAAGFSGALSVAQGVIVHPGVSAVTTLSNRPPSGAAVARVRRVRALRPQATSLQVPILYATLKATGSFLLPSGTHLSVTVPTAYILADTVYYLGLTDPSDPQAGFQAAFAGPAAISGDTLSFTTANTWSVPGGVPETLELYALSAFAPQPTPPPPPSSEYTLTGKEVQLYTYTYGYPSPQPPTTVDTSVLQNVTVRPSATSLPGHPNVADVHVNETDSTALQTINAVGDAYVGLAGANLVMYQLSGSVPPEGSAQGTDVLETYDTPQIIDSASSSWTNQPGGKLVETYTDGHSYTRVIANDGSYRETGYAQAPDGSGYTKIALQENADGSGSYGGPFAGYPSVIFAFAQPAGSPAAIDMTLSIDGAPPSPYATIPAWFTDSPPLYSQTNTVASNVTVPSQCGTGKATAVTQSITRIDTVIGYTEKSIRTTYRSSYGATGVTDCIQFTDVLGNYYNWNGDTPYFFYYSPNAEPISAVVTGELLTLAPAPIGSSMHRAIAGGISDTVSAELTAAAQSRFAAKMAAVRRHYVRRLIKYLASGHYLVKGSVR